MNDVRLTRRGKFVVSLLVILAVALFTYVTRDVCWIGTGYGSCIADLYDNRTGGGR
jgi:hypothetical protein